MFDPWTGTLYWADARAGRLSRWTETSDAQPWDIGERLGSIAPIPSALRPEPSAAIDRVFAKALAKNREDRYDSCSEFARKMRSAS